MSQICAFNVLPSTVIERVANSTPIVDFVSRLNSLRVNRESTREGNVVSNHPQRDGSCSTYGYFSGRCIQMQCQ